MSWDKGMKNKGKTGALKAIQKAITEFKMTRKAWVVVVALGLIGLMLRAEYYSPESDYEILKNYREPNIGDNQLDLLIPEGRKLLPKKGYSYKDIEKKIGSDKWDLIDYKTFTHSPEVGKKYIWIAISGNDKGMIVMERLLSDLNMWLHYNELQDTYELNVLMLDQPILSPNSGKQMFLHAGLYESKWCGALWNSCIDNFVSAPLMSRSGNDTNVKQWKRRLLGMKSGQREIKIGDQVFRIEGYDDTNFPEYLPMFYISNDEGKVVSIDTNFSLPEDDFPGIKKYYREQGHIYGGMDAIQYMSEIMRIEGLDVSDVNFPDKSDYSRIANRPIVKMKNFEINDKQKSMNWISKSNRQTTEVLKEALERYPNIQKCVATGQMASEKCESTIKKPISPGD